MVSPPPGMRASTPPTDLTGRLANGLKHAPATSAAEYPSIERSTNFLDILDHKLYRSITAGLPALEELSLGYADFYANYPTYEQGIFYERLLLHHLAAFRGMLPKIKEVSIGTIDGLTLEERPRTEWACLGVESLRISHHADIYREVILSLLRLGLEIYFPNSGLATNPLYRRDDMFNRAN